MDCLGARRAERTWLTQSFASVVMQLEAADTVLPADSPAGGHVARALWARCDE